MKNEIYLHQIVMGKSATTLLPTIERLSKLSWVSYRGSAHPSLKERSARVFWPSFLENPSVYFT